MKKIFKRLNSIRKTDTSSSKSGAPSSFLKKEHSSLYYLFYFLVLVGICIGIAVAVRFFLLVQKSTFSTSSYAVLISSKNHFIAVLDQTSSRLNIVSISGKTQGNRLKESLLLGVPIDGEMRTSSQNISKNSFPDMIFLVSLTFRPWLYSYSDMTIIDMTRLTFSSLSVSKKNVSLYSIKRSKTGTIEGVSPAQLYDIFKDSTIINEQVSIEIVNATSIQGLAGSTGQVLKNLGCNVVSITSADQESSSRIIAGSPSVTLTRTSHILGIPSDIDPAFHGTTDVKIILGQDFGDKVK